MTHIEKRALIDNKSFKLCITFWSVIKIKLNEKERVNRN